MSAMLLPLRELIGSLDARETCPQIELACGDAPGSTQLGAIALVMDLGRPERFVNMLRTVKLTSPMSLGSWILSAFSGAIARRLRGNQEERQ